MRRRKKRRSLLEGLTRTSKSKTLTISTLSEGLLGSKLILKDSKESMTVMMMKKQTEGQLQLLESQSKCRKLTTAAILGRSQL